MNLGINKTKKLLFVLLKAVQLFLYSTTLMITAVYMSKQFFCIC